MEINNKDYPDYPACYSCWARHSDLSLLYWFYAGESVAISATFCERCAKNTLLKGGDVFQTKDELLAAMTAYKLSGDDNPAHRARNTANSILNQTNEY